MHANPSMAGLGFLLSDAARLLRRRFQQKARGVGLTSAHWELPRGDQRF